METEGERATIIVVERAIMKLYSDVIICPTTSLTSSNVSFWTNCVTSLHSSSTTEIKVDAPRLMHMRSFHVTRKN